MRYPNEGQSLGPEERKPSEELQDALVESITAEAFQMWYDDFQTKENVLQGQTYFNKPPTRKEPQRHSPSQLKQCKRKISYRRNNSPKEGDQPDGVFYVGTTVEEELVVPFLQSIAPEGLYLMNSMWVDGEVSVDDDSLHIRGSTDPAITTATGEPVVVTEIKTTSSIDYLDAPRTHHKAQLLAYLFCLEKEYDHAVRDGVVVYISRDTLDLRAFPV